MALPERRSVKIRDFDGEVYYTLGFKFFVFY